MKQREELQVMRGLVSELLDIVEAEFNDDPEPEDLKSWKRLIERAHKALDRKTPAVAPSTRACEAMNVEIIGLDPNLQHRRRQSWHDELEGGDWKPTAPLPPEDPDWTPEDTFSASNQNRAEWAGLALQTYNLATGSDVETAVKDLIGDLGHWCDRHGLDLWDQWESGGNMYHEETRGKGTQFHAK